MNSKALKIILIGLVVLLNFFIFRPSLVDSFNSLHGKNLVGEVKLGKLWGNFDKLRSDALEFSGWSENDKIDLSLDPQTKGVTVYQFTKPEIAQVVSLQVAVAQPNQGTNRISVSIDQQSWQTVGENKYYHFVPLDITDVVGNEQKFWVKIEASNEATAGQPAVIVYDLYLMFYRHEVKLPPLVLILTTIFFPYLLIFRPKKPVAVKLALLFIVLALGLHLSLRNLFDYRYHSFDSDVICLTQEVPRFLSLDIKSALLGNYCGNKESLNPLIIIAFWKIFGFGSEMGIRFSSLIFHWLTVILVFWYGKKVISFTAGLTAALFIGTQPYLIQLSARGLRDSAFTFILALFIYLLFETRLKKIRHIMAIFLTSLFSIYLRLHSLVQLIGLTLVFVIAKRKLKHGLVLITMILLIAWPLIATNLKAYQTWNYSEEMHLKWNTNVEFAGQPGFSSKESITINPFQGPKISATTYFFKLHSSSDLVVSTLAGVRKTFEDLYFRHFQPLVILFIAGSWLMLRNKLLWYIPVLVFFLEIPHFFLAAKNLIEFRSMTQSLPFIGLTIGYIIDRLWTKLKRF